MKILSFFTLFLVYSSSCAGPDEPVRAFIIPHSHMDVGWVYTVQVGIVKIIHILIKTF